MQHGIALTVYWRHLCVITVGFKDKEMDLKFAKLLLMLLRLCGSRRIDLFMLGVVVVLERDK